MSRPRASKTSSWSPQEESKQASKAKVLACFPLQEEEGEGRKVKEFQLLLTRENSLGRRTVISTSLLNVAFSSFSEGHFGGRLFRLSRSELLFGGAGREESPLTSDQRSRDAC